MLIALSSSCKLLFSVGEVLWVSVNAAGGVQKATNQIHSPGDTWKAGRNFEATFAVPPPPLYALSSSLYVRESKADSLLFWLGTARWEKTDNTSTQRGTQPSLSEFQSTSETSLFCSESFAQTLSQWQTKRLRIQRLQVGFQMRDHLRLSSSEETEMSATILSAFYDIDMLYKVLCWFNKQACFLSLLELYKVNAWPKRVHK